MIVENTPYLIVLGMAQDGGIPHSGCERCCADKWNDPSKYEKVASVAVIDPESNGAWIIDATPDFPAQLNAITSIHSTELKGIFLTHAHIGHYTGLIHLGREVMGSKMMPVYTMPRLKSFLENNGPWSQLAALNNITIKKLQNAEPVKITEHISVTPFTVPHRDEFSETVGYRITGAKRELIYIPDIDKWSKWKQDIREIVQNVDIALLDGTFYENGEIPNRDMSEIPHPFIEETMNLFKESSSDGKGKIHFIHLNHTNPAHDEQSQASKTIHKRGFHIAREGQKFKL